MAIKAYVGRMGSGKSFEVVSNVIVPALARGRRVVSNIAGLNYDAIKEFLVASGTPEGGVGELVNIAHDDVTKPGFWRTDKDDEEGVDPVIQPGDLIALDEIWRFFEGFAKPSERCMNFFRMHRHFTHPVSGVACDVAIITQDVNDIGRKVKSVVEETYRMEKHTAIGSTKRYRIDIFKGASVTKNKFLRSLQRSYDAKYFPLYSSHSQKKEGAADAVEENIDDRGNILKGALFKVVLPAGLLVLIFVVYWLWHFFHPTPKDADKKRPDKPAAEVSQAKPETPPESEWRIVGYYVESGNQGFYISDGSRRRILLNPPVYKITGFSAETFLPNGDPVTTWGGSRKGGLIDQAAGAKP